MCDKRRGLAMSPAACSRLRTLAREAYPIIYSVSRGINGQNEELWLPVGQGDRRLARALESHSQRHFLVSYSLPQNTLSLYVIVIPSSLSLIRYWINKSLASDKFDCIGTKIWDLMEAVYCTHLNLIIQQKAFESTGTVACLTISRIGKKVK